MAESGKMCLIVKQFMLLEVQMAYSSITIIRWLCFEMQSHYTPQLFSTSFIREFTKDVNGTVGEECAHKN